MDKIVIRHTSIVINNYHPGDCIRLEDYFTLRDRVTHSDYVKGLIYDDIRKQLILPRGLDIDILENLFNTTAVVDYNYDPYETVPPILMKCVPRDDAQKKTLRFALGRGEYRHNQERSQICVNNNTGSGKTYIASAVIAVNLLKTIVIASKTGILTQWVNRLGEYTDITPRDICNIDGVGTINRLLATDCGSKYKIFFITHKSLTSYAATKGWSAVGELFRALGIGLKIYDEYHECFDNILFVDGYTNTYKTLYLSATPARSDKDENRIYHYAFKNVPSIELFDQEKDPHTAYIAIKFNSRPTPNQISECKNQYGLDRNKYANYVVHQPEFELLMYYIMNVISHTKGKVLIYVQTNAAIMVIYRWILENFNEYYYQIGIYTSIIDKDIKEEALNKKIILSTTKSCGAAMDIKGLNKTIILAEPFKSEVLARQVLGRTRDKDTICIECVDMAFRQIYKFYKQKQDIFDKYATSSRDLTLNHAALEARAETYLAQREYRPFGLIFNKPRMQGLNRIRPKYGFTIKQEP